MKLTPLGNRILIRRVEEEEEITSGGIILLILREKSQEAEVVVVGKGRGLDSAQRLPINFEVRDRILFGKYAATEVTYEGQAFVILREDAVLGKIV